MLFQKLTVRDQKEVVTLFCRCFSDDPYYSSLLSQKGASGTSLEALAATSIQYCLQQGICFGLTEKERLIAFILCFDYRSSKSNDPQAFHRIFSAGPDTGPLPYQGPLHDHLSSLPGEIVYCLSVASDPAFRRQGMASFLVDHVLRSFPGHYFVSDVSNPSSLEIYRRRCFSVQNLDTDYYLVIHAPQDPLCTFSVQDTVRIAVPSVRFLEEQKIPFRATGGKVLLEDVRHETSFSVESFVPAPHELSAGLIVELCYPAYLEYQRAINVSHYEERTIGDTAYYVQLFAYRSPPLYNDTLRKMLPTRRVEWSLIPDLYVSVPVWYDSVQNISRYTTEPSGKASALLEYLRFRTYYEAGIPTDQHHIDDLTSFKQRIRRFYLGKLWLQIALEPSPDRFDCADEPIGSPAMIDLYLSVDVQSHCGVLTWYSLSAPFLLSHLMDNVVSNRLTVVEEGRSVNFFSYINDRFGLTKRGTAKIFAVLPAEKTVLKENQMASLLASETIYPDGENFGKITAPEILSCIRSENGMGQYDRAFVYAYTNVVLQFSPGLQASLTDRICEESITLFYIELILLEEAAIGIADQDIAQLFSSDLLEKPTSFLKRVDTIFDEYSKTIAFWDIQVNYPTSQMSIDMLRTAFGTHKQLEFMQRNQQQLQLSFSTKCDYIDRNESNHMNTSLSIISFLAVFSAWIDSYDYVDTWADPLSPFTVDLLQKILFLVILLIANYALVHMFSYRLLRRFQTKKRDNRYPGKPKG